MEAIEAAKKVGIDVKTGGFQRFIGAFDDPDVWYTRLEIPLVGRVEIRRTFTGKNVVSKIPDPNLIKGESSKN